MILSDRILYTIENRYIRFKGLDGLCLQLSQELVAPADEVKSTVLQLIKDGEIFESSKGKYSTLKMLGYKKCQISGTSKGYCFAEILDSDEEDIFIAEKNSMGALNRDIVIVKILKSTPKSPEGKVVKILRRESDQLVGTYHTYRSYGIVYPDDIKINKNIYIYRGNSLNAKEGDKVVVSVTNFHGKGNLVGKVIEVIGDINAKGNDILSIIRNYKLYEKFPEEVERYAESVPQKISEKSKKGRLDLTKEIIFTIDGEDTRDIDDAISLSINDNGTYHLGVHIADVSEYVKQDSILDKEAFNRATSVYFPDRVLPMLPKQLSNGICSLNENEERLTLSVFMDIDKNAKVLKHKIQKSFIKSCHRMTYTDVQKILDKDKATTKNYSDIAKVLLNMNKLCDILEADRSKRGALNFDIPETYVELDENGKTKNITPRERKKAHRLIESFMIVCNETVAQDMYTKKAPFVYRVHEKPTSDKMTAFMMFINSLGINADIDVRNVVPKDLQDVIKQVEHLQSKGVVNTVMLRSLKKARYLPQCLGHFGLASTYYCHFTSPIRRYPDLVIHRIIKMFLDGKLKANKPFLENFVIRASLQSSEKEKTADEAERAVDDLKKAEYMSNYIGEEYDGIISGVLGKGFFVELSNTCEGFVSIDLLPKDYYDFDDRLYELRGKHNFYKLGEAVKVRVDSVNLKERKINFSLICKK